MWSSLVLALVVLLMTAYSFFGISYNRSQELSFFLLWAYFGAIIGYFIAKYLKHR